MFSLSIDFWLNVGPDLFYFVDGLDIIKNIFTLTNFHIVISFWLTLLESSIFIAKANHYNAGKFGYNYPQLFNYLHYSFYHYAEIIIAMVLVMWILFYNVVRLVENPHDLLRFFSLWPYV